MVRLSAFFVKWEAAVPEKDGKLTENEIQSLQKWLGEKWTNRNCVTCGVNNWNLNPYIAIMPLHTPGRVLVGGPSFPVVPVVCNNCGNALLFNAVTIGLMNVAEGSPQGGTDVK
jgi:hypothetical protein